ncbi:hypothetical protein LJC56_06915 [Christensenellaceae bacterium OttesenSCG-928-K19]|nr:hypothetical protein [Christensenellaceae bacterium OttesenSCG-928-K19]
MAARDTGVKIAKGVLYVLLQIGVAVLIVLLIFLAYYTAENTMNVNMMVEDAFAYRAQAILRPAEDASAEMETLRKLFTNTALARDEVLHSTAYDDFTIVSYYEQADIEFHIVWPWDTRTKVTVTETVRDIMGDPIPEEGEELPEDKSLWPQPEEWENGVYEVSLVKDKDAEIWKISGFEFKEAVDVSEMVPEPIVAEESLAAESESPEPEGEGQ